MAARSWVVAKLALVLIVGACGPPAAPIRDDRPREATMGAVAALVDIEDEVLRDLAAIDRRFAARAQIEPREEDLRRVTMGAVLAEDATLAVIDGAIDPFSFEARARGLSAVRARLTSAPLGRLPGAAPGSVSSPALEWELLTRLVEGELVRLDEERALPRAASALLRGLLETWRPPTSPPQAVERDRWLSHRLGEVLAAVNATNAPPGASAPLDVMRARELDDALDALEHAIDAAGLGHATAELVLLREALESRSARPVAGAASDWAAVARGLQAHLGVALPADVLDARLTRVEDQLAKEAASAFAQGRGRADKAETAAQALVFASTPCVVPIVGSRVRSMAPPPERAPLCRLLRVAAAATDGTSRAVGLVAIHDHVTVARGAATLAQTTAKHRPLSRPAPDILARWERIALAQPTAAIGAGIAAAVLYGGSDPQERARVWSALGDVPLDIAERELR